MALSFKYILFDLDGTLTDPKEGITKSVQHALRAFETLGKPMAAVINRSGQPSAAACEAELIAFCGEKGLPVAARLPFDREAAARAAAGRHPMLDSEDWRECLSEAARSLSTLFEGGHHA